MKTYCYETADGEIHEVRMTYDEMRQREKKGVIVLDDGRKATRSYASELAGRHVSGAGWPMSLWNTHINKSQAKELNGKLVAQGIAPVEFDSNTSFKVESPSHQRKVLAAIGMFNKDDTRSPRNL